MQDRHLAALRAEFPNLPRSALDFFTGVGDVAGRTMREFAQSRAIDVAQLPRGQLLRLPDFTSLHTILQRLCAASILQQIGPAAGLRADETLYLYLQPEDRRAWQYYVAEFVAYGFPAVVEAFTPIVYQIVNHGHEDAQSSGTAFVVSRDMLVTNRHVVADAAAISIVGLNADDLAGCRVYIPVLEQLDCAAIRFPRARFAGDLIPMWESAAPADEVLLMGYPNIPALFAVNLVERANVATILRGGAAGRAADIQRSEWLVVTAPVRGGFSGGPVITTSGMIIGMIAASPAALPGDEFARRYDTAGFGLAIPSEAVVSFLSAVNDGNAQVIRELNGVVWRD